VFTPPFRSLWSRPSRHSATALRRRSPGCVPGRMPICRRSRPRENATTKAG